MKEQEIKCGHCEDVFSTSTEQQYNGEVLLIGAQSKNDFLIAFEAAMEFKTWEERRLVNKEGISAARMGEVDLDGIPYCKVFCNSDNGRIVVEIQPFTVASDRTS